MIGFFLIDVYYILDIVIIGRKLRMIILSFLSISRREIVLWIIRLKVGNIGRFLEFSSKDFTGSFVFKSVFSLGEKYWVSYNLIVIKVYLYYIRKV